MAINYHSVLESYSVYKNCLRKSYLKNLIMAIIEVKGQKHIFRDFDLNYLDL